MSNQPLHNLFVGENKITVILEWTSPLTWETTDISRCRHWFSRQLTSEQRLQRFHTNDVSLAFDWSGVPQGKLALTNQSTIPHLGSNRSSIWNFCACSSDIISRGTKRWGREMSAVFSSFKYIFCSVSVLQRKPIHWRSDMSTKVLPEFHASYRILQYKNGLISFVMAHSLKR